MAESSTTLRKGDKLPPRGKAQQTLILEAIKGKALLDLPEDASRDDIRKAVFGYLAEAAFNPTEETAMISNTALNTIMKKGWPDLKAIDPVVEFELDTSLSPDKQASQIMKAIADGVLSPSIGVSLITAMAAVLKIVEITDLEARIELLECQNDGE